MQGDWVVLVDSHDRELGIMEKLEAHEKGLLHRAFSVICLNDQGELLLQQRAAHKYHSQNLWTNTCCSHPRPGERISEAAERRLQEEMGFQCETTAVYHFVYQTPLENNLIEHELDHVLIGRYNGEVHPNPEEVQAIRWISLSKVQEEILQHPEQFTFWFKEILQHEAFLSHIKHEIHS